MKILIADADEETRLVLAEAIAAVRPDVRVVETRDGRELQAALAGAAPDILFIDTILPGADAAAIMAWRESVGARTVVVLVADLLADRWSGIARRIDAYDVMLKPLTAQGVDRVLQAAEVLRRGLSLLFAEPSGRTRALAGHVLRRSLFDFSVTEAEGGASALRAARLQDFDLALVSFGLVDMPALEVACRIEALHPGTRIVMVGRRSEAMTSARLALFGARAFLPMPFTVADVDRLTYEVFDLWQPYLVKALRGEEARRDEQGQAGKVAASA
jgi:DNA-binding NtrC family response regulator